MRQEHNDRSHAGENAVIEERFERPLGHSAGGVGSQGGNEILDGVHDRLGQPEDGDEQRGHDEGEDQQTPDFVNENRIDFVGQGALGGRVIRRQQPLAGGDERPGSDSVDPLIMGFDISFHRVNAHLCQAVVSRMKQRSDGLARPDGGDIRGGVADEKSLGQCGGRAGNGHRFEQTQPAGDKGQLLFDRVRQLPIGQRGDARLADGGNQLFDALLLVAHHGNDRHAKLPGKAIGADMNAAALGHVDHIECDDQRLAHFD